MNKERLLRVADYIERDNPRHKVRFDMADYRIDRTCGTFACIAGTALYLFDRPAWEDGDEDHHDAARDCLGLTEIQAFGLFLPEDWCSHCPPSVAVDVIRKFVKTGRIRWPRRLPS